MLCQPGQAATSPSNIAVSATVQAACLNTATALTFGVYTGFQADATATITITCTNTTPYTVGLSAGASASATPTARKMTGTGGALLAYSMFTDAARTINWGNAAQTNWVTGTGSGAGQPLTVYGRIAANQFVAPGAYTDTVTATVTY
jgi:spore coat protein U-like protein